jgi:hypothetical protein
LKLFIMNLFTILTFGFAISILSDDLSSPFQYYDGDSEKTIYLLKDHIVEFSKGKSRYKETDPDAKEIGNYPNFKILKSKSSKIQKHLERKKITKQSKNVDDTAPVFSEDGSENNLMIYAGKILVQFPDHFSKKQVDLWAIQNKIKNFEKVDLPFGNYYNLETTPDLEGIQKATEIKNSADVISVSPEFLRKPSLR